MSFIASLRDRDRGATMVEYGLIVGVISLMSLSAVTLLGDATGESFDKVTVAIENDGSGDGSVESSNGGTGDQGGGGDTGSATTTTTTPATTTTTAAPTTTTTTPETTTTAPETTTTTMANPEGTVQSGSTSSSLDSWDRGRGEWTASVEYSNDFSQDQYLTFVITEIDDKGRTTTTTVTGFVVPAGGSATYDHTGNSLREQRNGYKGVLEVQVEVVSATTANGDQGDITYQVSNQVSTVSAPTP